jgi:hypothetical protein
MLLVRARRTRPIRTWSSASVPERKRVDWPARLSSASAAAEIALPSAEPVRRPGRREVDYVERRRIIEAADEHRPIGQMRFDIGDPRVGILPVQVSSDGGEIEAPSSTDGSKVDDNSSQTGRRPLDRATSRVRPPSWSACQLKATHLRVLAALEATLELGRN